jgi:hypothetical protein
MRLKADYKSDLKAKSLLFEHHNNINIQKSQQPKSIIKSEQ